MKKVTLHFKKKDFDNDYGNSENCAISTALKRAGYPNLQDAGTCILDSGSKEYQEAVSYDKMTKKVFAIYKYLNPDYKFGGNIEPVEPRNFQATILLDV